MGRGWRERAHADGKERKSERDGERDISHAQNSTGCRSSITRQPSAAEPSVVCRAPLSLLRVCIIYHPRTRKGSVRVCVRVPNSRALLLFTPRATAFLRAFVHTSRPQLYSSQERALVLCGATRRTHTRGCYSAQLSTRRRGRQWPPSSHARSITRVLLL